MANFNHERPYLKYIDNLKKDINRSIFLSHEQDEKAAIKKDSIKGKGILKKIDKISLKSEELKNINELFFLWSENNELFNDYVESLTNEKGKLVKSKKGKYKKYIEKSESNKKVMIRISYILMVSDLIESKKGRDKGAFDFINIIGEYLHVNESGLGSDLFEDIFVRASELLAVELIENA